MDHASASRPPPAPLEEGEHVLCNLTDNTTDAPVDAVVIERDSVYVAAAQQYTERCQPALPTGVDIDGFHSPPRYTPPHDLTETPYGDGSRPSRPSPATAFDNDNTTVDLTKLETIDLDIDVSGSKITFREADEGGSRRASHHTKAEIPHFATTNAAAPSTPSRPNRRTREVSMPAGIEAYASNSRVKPSALPAPHPIQVGRVYVHFSGRDRRLDRWVNASELERSPASFVAAAASGLVQNTLVDNAVQTEFAVVDTGKQPKKLTRSRRREFEEANPISERELGNEAIAQLERAREESTKVRNISSIVFGDYHVDAWYFSPFPEPYGSAKTLYMCKFCLKYVRTRTRYTKHCSSCTQPGPPGAVVYEDPEQDLKVFEIDGNVNALYCERLCLLAKLFLDHKTIFYDVGIFMFYVVTVGDELAGYFSKESPLTGSEYNLACILTLPQHQRKGIGNFIISFSYELSKIDGKIGSPERPLSDLGQVSYRSYWAYSIIQYLRSQEDQGRVSARDVSQATAIRLTDVCSTLKSIHLVRIWKGETYAVANAKELGAAESRMSKPRLLVNVNELRKRYSSRQGVANGKAETAKRAQTDKRKTPGRRKEESAPAEGRNVKSGRRAEPSPEPSQGPNTDQVPEDSSYHPPDEPDGDDGPQNSSGSHPPLESSSASDDDPHTPVRKKARKSPARVLKPSKYNLPGSQRGFTRHQLEVMVDFIANCKPEVVMASMNSQRGLSSATVQRLAEGLGMSAEKCRKKLRSLAENIMVHKEDFPKGQGTRGLPRSEQLQEQPPVSVDIDGQGVGYGYSKGNDSPRRRAGDIGSEMFAPGSFDNVGNGFRSRTRRLLRDHEQDGEDDVVCLGPPQPAKSMRLRHAVSRGGNPSQLRTRGFHRGGY